MACTSAHAHACVIEISVTTLRGHIQVLRNANGGGGCNVFRKKPVTDVYGSMLLALRGGGGGPISRKKALRNT